ncbi:hypothetical protein C5F51_14775 [Nocardia nova]|uniref:Uncharacterized protein n=1 Tax=Nocardia nova TaxID=37330 RepID=A0A2S6A694_9NOCA|nr:hypothetical protein C5F51_14775 [Nocardia nova]
MAHCWASGTSMTRPGSRCCAPRPATGRWRSRAARSRSSRPSRCRPRTDRRLDHDLWSFE